MNDFVACNVDMLTVKDLARIMQLSPSAAYRMARNTKDFKVLRIGKSIRIHKQSFYSWLNTGVPVEIMEEH